MKDQPFFLVLMVGTALIIVGLALGMGVGFKQSQKGPQPLEIIHTKPIITPDRPADTDLVKKTKSNG